MFIKIAALLLVGSTAFAQTQSETESAAQPRSTPAKRSAPRTLNNPRVTDDETTTPKRKTTRDSAPTTTETSSSNQSRSSPPRATPDSDETLSSSPRATPVPDDARTTSPRATPNPLPTPAGADTPILRDEKSAEKPVEKPVKLGRTKEEIERDRRSKERAEGETSSTFGVAYNLSPLGFPVIFKHGPSVWWPAEGRWQLELGYLTGGLSLDQLGAEIGSATESLITLNARRYSRGGHFNWIIGLSHQSYDATLGSDLMAAVSNTQASLDVVKTRTIGLQLGMGNRWEWSNFVVAADWFIINVPFMTSSSEAPALDYINNPNAKARIEDAISIMRRLPSIVLSKVTLGYEF